jgi:hypothetical protein
VRIALGRALRSTVNHRRAASATDAAAGAVFYTKIGDIICSIQSPGVAGAGAELI